MDSMDKTKNSHLCQIKTNRKFSLNTDQNNYRQTLVMTITEYPESEKLSYNSLL